MADQSNTVGRSVKVSGASIEGIVSCLPHRQISNSYFETEFGKAAVKDVVKMIGVENRYWADESISTKDLCSNAGKFLKIGLGTFINRCFDLCLTNSRF